MRQMMKEFEGLGGIIGSLHQLKGHRRTSIVVTVLSNACAVLRLMDDYAYGATSRRSDLRLLELADAELLRLANFARDTVS